MITWTQQGSEGSREGGGERGREKVGEGTGERPREQGYLLPT